MVDRVTSDRGRHRRSKPRFGRIALAATAATVTAIALAGGLRLLGPPATATDPSAVAADATYRASDSASPSVTATPSASVETPPAVPSASASVDASSEAPAPDTLGPSLPADSGRGRRVVFSEGQQRVWLVSRGQHVKRTYPVSGSLYDNLDPGTYQVYSRSQDAAGVDGSTMHMFVRFTQGQNAAIGFHTIPELGGSPVQTVAQLGTPLSHGCIRQKERDALAMWYFGQIGTTVVVTA